MFEIPGSIEFTGKNKETEVYIGICDDFFFLSFYFFFLCLMVFKYHQTSLLL